MAEKDVETNENETEGNVDSGIDDLLDTLDISTDKEAGQVDDDDKSGDDKDSTGGTGDSESSEDSEDTEEDENGAEETDEKETSETSETEEEEGEVDEEDESSVDDETDELSELEQLKAQNEALMAQLNVAGDSGQQEIVEEDEEQEVIEPKNELKEFLGSLDTTVLEDPKNFAEAMETISEISTRQATEKVLRSIPNVVMSQILLQKSVKETVDKFYEKNEDLRPVSKYLGRVANEVAAENPDMTMDKVFSEAAKKTRKALHLNVKTKKPEPTPKRKRKPAFVKKVRGERSRGEQQISDLEADIANTLDL